MDLWRESKSPESSSAVARTLLETYLIINKRVLMNDEWIIIKTVRPHLFTLSSSDIRAQGAVTDVITN